MAGKEVVVSVEEEQQQDVAIDQFGISVDGSDHPFGISVDGSDHMTTLADLKSKFGRSPSSSSSSKLQCPKVPKRLRSDVKGEGYYAPKLISLGPYHHGKSHLEDGESLKLTLAEAYIQRCKWTVEKIYSIICRRINELRGCYDGESIKKYKDDKFTAMMLVDGCALLRYIFSVWIGWFQEDLNIRYQDLSLLNQDVWLLENQLPFQLLTMLWSLEHDFLMLICRKFVRMNNRDSFLQKNNHCCRWYSFLINQIITRQPQQSGQPVEEYKPCHLLDLFRRNILGDKCPRRTDPEDQRSKDVPMMDYSKNVAEVMKSDFLSFRNAKELMAAGIRIKRSHTGCLKDISFTSNGITACLRLPPITIDNSTKTLFLNLIAYEMSSDVPHDFISYLRFLDSLVDNADDVKELQSAWVLQNNLGTHEEVAQFFNTVSANLESNFHAYKDVRVKIRKHLQSHYNSKLRMWMTQCLDTYFGSPWTIIAWVGAALILFFTAVQTFFSAFHH